MKTTIAACAAAILTTASLLACIGGSSTSANASPAGLGGGGHPTGTGLHTGAPVGGWGPHFTRREGYIPGISGTPPARAIEVPGADQTSGLVQIVKCPCTLERDPLVTRPLFGGAPNNMLKVLKAGVGNVEGGTFLLGNSPATATDQYNAMVTTWGPNFDPHDFSGGKYIGPK